MWDVCQTAVFDDWWCELCEQEQDDVTAVVELLAEKGPQLPFPYSSGVGGSRHSPTCASYAFSPMVAPCVCSMPLTQSRRALRRTPQQSEHPTQAMTRSFSELTKDFSPERRERIEQRKEQLRQEMTLAELRKAFSLTQDTLAKNLNVKQAEISKIENRADMLMSTLRNFVQAMGGDLEVRAVFPDRAIEISTFSSLSGKPAKSRIGKKKKPLVEA
jgi:DNA-binding XRE family transcriptional regulator